MLDERPLEKRTHSRVMVDGQEIFSAPRKTVEQWRITKEGRIRILQKVKLELSVAEQEEWWRDIDFHFNMFFNQALSPTMIPDRKNLKEIERQATMLRRSCEAFVKQCPHESPSPITEIASLHLLAEWAKNRLKYVPAAEKPGPKSSTRKKQHLKSAIELFEKGFGVQASTQSEDGPFNRFVMALALEKAKKEVSRSWLRTQDRERVRAKSPKKEN